jgi:hypothetical protein
MELAGLKIVCHQFGQHLMSNAAYMDVIFLNIKYLMTLKFENAFLDFAEPIHLFIFKVKTLK